MERYDADGDLSVPMDAQGRPFEFNSSNGESDADQRRKNVCKICRTVHLNNASFS